MSSEPAIRVEGLGKQYRLGGGGNGSYYQYKSLRDSIGAVARRPFDVLTRNRRLTDDNSFWALKDVAFEVQPGEVVGIIGRNGAGKSTLLKVLSQITKPTTGLVEIRGRVGSLLEVGTGFHPELSGRENIFLNGAILGMTRAEVRAKFDEIVAFSEIERFLDTPVKQYSSGMYTRLAFAVAAHLDPEILVVDEVLSVGDAAFQKKCLGKMKDVAGEGRTVLFVSHNMGAVTTLCTRCFLLSSGTVVSSGETLKVTNEYRETTTGGVADKWRGPPNPVDETGFRRIRIGRSKSTPSVLDCTLEIYAESSLDLMLAVDISEPGGSTLMQALPADEPVLSFDRGLWQTGLSISLPPLIPATYIASFWIGRSHSDTVDWVQEAVCFEVTESPTPGRTTAHSQTHGYIVPQSRITYTKRCCNT